MRQDTEEADALQQSRETMQSIGRLTMLHEVSVFHAPLVHLAAFNGLMHLHKLELMCIADVRFHGCTLDAGGTSLKLKHY